jgi:Zn ribbon nucleic-acid-binding protein
MEINKITKQVEFYQWKCPGCGKELEIQGYQPHENALRCVNCEYDEDEKRKKLACEKFRADHLRFIGLLVKDVVPIEDELLAYNGPGTGIDHIIIFDSDKVYKITADGPLYLVPLEAE